MALSLRATSGPAAESGWLAGLLPLGVATAELAGAGDPALLLDAERAALNGAGPARARTFAAGRLCARRAMARFGHGDDPLGVQCDGRPRWPAALTGSITHTGGFAAAAVGERRRFRAIGIDAAGVGAVTVDLWRHLFGPAESRWLEGLPRAAQEQAGALLFSAKEAFFKCQYEVTGQWLEFHDVVVDCAGIDPARSAVAVRPARRLARLDEGQAVVVRYAFRDGLVLTAAALDAH